MKRHIAAICLLVVATGAIGSADTLVLMNGRRIQGELLGVYGREIEFEERAGGARRVMRVPRADIVRIEFLEEQSGNQQDVRPVIPPRLRERNVTVSPTAAWTDTGIDVRAGQEIYFQTWGQVTWSPNKRVDANGTRDSKSNPARPLPTRNGGALIGRIGDRDTFLIGLDVGPFRIRQNGRLYLGVNDDNLEDNTGFYYVVVSY
ncbi:MAG TPA: hypothetical protein VFD21_14340 [Vicinamibacterales bacterium]|nr:hypothetical protein [Vicinamibacterales bacterium]